MFEPVSISERTWRLLWRNFFCSAAISAITFLRWAAACCCFCSYYYPPSADHYQSCPLHHVTLRNNNIICTLVYQNCSANRAKAGFKNSIFKIQFNLSIQLNKSFVDQQQPLVMPEVEKQNY